MFTIKNILKVMMLPVLLIAAQVQATDTIRFAATEVAGLEALQTNFGPFKEKLEELTGKHVEFFGHVSNRLIPHS